MAGCAPSARARRSWRVWRRGRSPACLLPIAAPSRNEPRLEMTALAPADLARTPAIRRPFPAGYRGVVAWGWAIVLLTFGGLALWSVLAPLGSAAIASGTIVVDSARKSVQHLEGGIVKKILVRDGDRVEAGQPLVQLDEALLGNSLDLVQGRLDADRAHEPRLIAEREGKSAVSFPPELLERAKTSAAVGEMLTGQAGIFQARRDSLAGQVSILENRIGQSKQQIEGLSLQVDSKVR